MFMDASWKNDMSVILCNSFTKLETSYNHMSYIWYKQIININYLKLYAYLFIYLL